MNVTSIARAVTFAATFAAASAIAPAALAGEVAPAGELTAFDRPAAMVSTKNRADMKAETKAGNKDGGYSSGKATYNAQNVAPREQLSKSTKTREERKAETMQAVQHKQLMRAGEAG